MFFWWKKQAYACKTKLKTIRDEVSKCTSDWNEDGDGHHLHKVMQLGERTNGRNIASGTKWSSKILTSTFKKYIACLSAIKKGVIMSMPRKDILADNACIKIVNYDNYTRILAKLNLSYVPKKRWQNKNLTATPRGIAWVEDPAVSLRAKRLPPCPRKASVKFNWKNVSFSLSYFRRSVPFSAMPFLLRFFN